MSKLNTDLHKGSQKRTVWMTHESLPPDLLAIKNWLAMPKSSRGSAPENREISAKIAI